MADDKTPRKRSQAKDRVLQARIPEQLDEELRGRAEQLGLSVSTIVRNVLLHTFDLVEGVVTSRASDLPVLPGITPLPRRCAQAATVAEEAKKGTCVQGCYRPQENDAPSAKMNDGVRLWSPQQRWLEVPADSYSIP